MKQPDWINTTSSASIFLIAGFFVHSVYLIMSGAASLVYIANVLLHVPLGLIVLYVLIRLIKRFRLGLGTVTTAFVLIV